MPAGLVDPVTGEGIYYAMRSGELLAESLLEGLPELYPARVQEEFGKALALGRGSPALSITENSWVERSPRAWSSSGREARDSWKSSRI